MLWYLIRKYSWKDKIEPQEKKKKKKLLKNKAIFQAGQTTFDLFPFYC